MVSTTTLGACAERIRDRVEAYLDAHSDVDAGPDVPETPSCDDGTDFAACGGLPIGAWTLERWCADGDSFDPLRGTCEDLIAEGSGDARAVLRVYAEGDYRLDWERLESEVAFEFPLWCFGGSTTPCSGSFYDGECEILGEDCLCSITNSYENFTESGFWRIDGRNLIFETAGVIHNQPYCVEQGGSTLRLARFGQDSEVGFVATFQKAIE